MKSKHAKRAKAQTGKSLMMNTLSPTSRAANWYSTNPGVPLAKPRFTPGFMLSPRSAGYGLMNLIEAPQVDATVLATKRADPQARPTLLLNVRNFRLSSDCPDIESAH
jgi:hypothetical protein